jgi:hypothetical protein
MATVYYYQEDDHKAENIAAIGNAVAGVVGAYKQRQVDREAQQMMQNISKTKTREEAMQVIGGASSKLLRDERLFGKVQSFLEAFQPGETALQVYDKNTGKIKLMPYKTGTVPSEDQFEANNARLDPFEEFYAKIPNVAAQNDPTQAPYSIEPLGKLGSRDEAMHRAFDTIPADVRQDITILNHKEAEGERTDLKANIDLAVKNRQTAIQEGRNRILRERNQVTQEAMEYTKTRSKSTLGKLHEDFINGNINKPQYEAAVKKELSDRSYKTATDKVVINAREDLFKKRVAIEKMTVVGNAFLDKIAEGGGQTGSIGSVVRGYDSLISQMKAGYESMGWSGKAVDDYKWPKSLAGESASTKALLVTLTMARLSAEGQTGRQVSDKDFERFNIGESGSPKQMLDIIKTVISSQQEAYYSEYKQLGDTYGIEPETKENRPFSVFGNKNQRAAQERFRKMQENYLRNPLGQPVDQITIERKVREATSELGELFQDDEEEE